MVEYSEMKLVASDDDLFPISILGGFCGMDNFHIHSIDRLFFVGVSSYLDYCGILHDVYYGELVYNPNFKGV